MSKSKKSSVDFLAGLAAIEENNAVKRHPTTKPASQTPTPAPAKDLPSSLRMSQQTSRIGKVAITQWVDPAVRKQLARLKLDIDAESQEFLLAEALNLLFEKYGLPPIAAPLSEARQQLESTT